MNRRLESEEGISFTEFSYLLLQAYDFLQLFDRYGCTLQMGGSDQWGNITAGIDLIRKLRAQKAHGLVMPLVTTASGVKFGKTEAGAVWLDPQRTSPFAFYQFWLNTDDRDVVHVLEVLHVSRARRDRGARAARDAAAPEKREAQRVLAREVTTLVHGARRVARGGARVGAVVRRGHRDAAGGRCAGGVRRRAVDGSAARASSAATGSAWWISWRDVKLASSRSEARRLMQGGGIYVNNRRIADPQSAAAASSEAIGGRAVRAAEGSEAESSCAAVDLTYRDWYEILSESFGARHPLQGSGEFAGSRESANLILSLGNTAR